MELNREARACNIEYSTTIDIILPINLPKVSTEGSNSLNFTSTEKCYPDFNKEIEVENLLNQYKGSDKAWVNSVSPYSFRHVTRLFIMDRKAVALGL